MKATDIPVSKLPLAFAANGDKQVIPEASQIGIVDGRASLNDGFPPLTRRAIAAGGVPPFGTDTNGILFMISAWTRWMNAGGQVSFDATFSGDTNVNGYPLGAILSRADGMGFWLSLADNNTTNPDSSGAANWAPLDSYGISVVSGLTTGIVTLTPAQYGLPIITLAGALTGNVQLIFPAVKSQWQVINNTTGNFSVTCKTASGTGVVIQQGGAANVYGDGANITLPPAIQIGAATASQHAVQFGQVSGVVGQSRNAKISTGASATSATTFTADEVILESALGGLRYCLANVSDTFNLTTDMDAGSAPASGFVALYKLYNPATGASLRRIVNSTSAIAPEIYAGAAPPAGFTASALVAVLPTNASGQFPGSVYLRNRSVSFFGVNVLSTNTISATYLSLNIGSAVPRNAIKCSGTLATVSTTNNTVQVITVAVDGGGVGARSLSGPTIITPSGCSSSFSIDVVTPQTLYYATVVAGSGTPTFTVNISSYEF